MKKDFLFRSWYYFRTGYSTYLAFVIAAINMLVVVYYLAIEKSPLLKAAFPSFTLFSILVIILGVPLSIFIGLLHMKRSPAYTSEIDISVESNPYYYKLPPGYWREVLAPAFLELLRLNVKLLNKEPLSQDEINSMEELQKKLEILINGGFVGKPGTMSL